MLFRLPITVAVTRELLQVWIFLKNYFETGANLPKNYQKCVLQRMLEGALNKVAITTGVV